MICAIKLMKGYFIKGLKMEPYDAQTNKVDHPLFNGSNTVDSPKHKKYQMVNAIYQAPVGVLITNAPDPVVLMVNPALENIIGIPGEKITGKHFTQTFLKNGGKLYYPDQTLFKSEKFTHHFLSAKHIVAKDFEVLLQRPDGKQLYILMSSSPVLDNNKKVVAITSILHDITDRKNKENANIHLKEKLKIEVERKTRDLKEMNSKLETIYNASSESIWVCDGKGLVISINKASENLLGIRASDVIGRNINNLVKEGLMDRSVTKEVLENKHQVSMIQKALKTGKQLLVTGTPVFDDDRQVSMVIVNERDLTQLNQLQEELQQVREETNRFKEELTSLNLKELEDQAIIAQSKEMQDVLITSQKLASMDISNILILGESGTGKGLLAKYIHKYNQRLTGPFVKINCAAVPESLLEAELFGYEKGSFTGASDQGKIGLFEMAQDGTLFLDEIGDLPLTLQAKLLHCLEEKEIMHIGGLKPIKTNCNVIAATNLDLAEQVIKKTFRKDLYFRLNTFPVTIPALRKRPEDIMELTLFFLDQYNKEYKLSRWISSLELKRMQSYSFPGNVRELKNSIKKAMILAEKNSLDSIVDYESQIAEKKKEETDNEIELSGKGFSQAINDFEQQIFSKALEEYKTTRSIANYLKMSQSQVVRKLTKHNLTHLLKRKMTR